MSTNDEFSFHNWVTFLIIHQAYITPNVSKENRRVLRKRPEFIKQLHSNFFGKYKGQVGSTKLQVSNHYQDKHYSYS